MNKPFLRPLIISLVSLAIFVALVFLYRIDEAQSTVAVMQILSDSALIAGAAIGGTGLLMLLGNYGAFDGISYGFKAGLHVILPFSSPVGKYSDYLDKRRTKKAGCKEFLIVGGIFLVLACLFLFLYFSFE